MSEEQTKKLANGIIGTLVFGIVYMIFRDLSLASLAVSYASPNLSAGPFDLWVIATSVLGPIAAAYVFVASKLGAGVVSLATMVINLVQSKTTPTTAAPIDTRLFASAKKTGDLLKDVTSRLAKLETTVKSWEESSNG